jgi:hypothetical protein
MNFELFLALIQLFWYTIRKFARGDAPMKTRTWILIFALLLVICLGASFAFLMPGEASSLAEITSHGQVVKTVDLRHNQEFTIEGSNGSYNVITVENGKIAVTNASCPDHYCMKRGFCNSGTEIVCLPNRMTIRFLGQQEIDAVIG